jgi:hypothetical protein
MTVRIDTFKPKPMYGQYLMELAPSHNDPMNELGRLWSNDQRATAYALAAAIKSAEAHRAGAGNWDRPKFHAVVIKLSNMLGRRGRLGSVALVNPRRGKRRGRRNPDAAPSVPAQAAAVVAALPAPVVAAIASEVKKNPGRYRRNARPGENQIITEIIRRKKNPSRSKRRSSSKKRMLKKYEGINRRTFKSPWNTRPGQSKLARRLKHWSMAIRAGISPGKLAKARERSVRGLRVNNPSAAWNKARKSARRKWLKDRFGYATHRSNPAKRTSRRKGARYAPLNMGWEAGYGMPWKKAKRYVRKSKQIWKSAFGSAKHHPYSMKRVNPSRSKRTGRFIRRGRK